MEIIFLFLIGEIVIIQEILIFLAFLCSSLFPFLEISQDLAIAGLDGLFISAL